MFATSLYSQTNRCSAYEKTEELKQNNPQFIAIQEQLEEETAEFIKNYNGVEATITIPVVVHVVYRTSSENISQNQILSQIAVLNEDYGAGNSDISQVPSLFANDYGDTDIRFCLASKDPNGAWTSGVTRTQTTVTSWNGSDNVKVTSQGGKDPWPRNKYLNIWVCNIGSGLLGYAYPPGASSSVDGVVIGYKYFGSKDYNDGSFVLQSPYNLGRTATHEVGHWLNLRHIWGDSNCGNDYVSDTPTQQTSNYGCPTHPHATCQNNGDMFMNYMDYVNDNCMVMFSNGQGMRMQAALASSSGQRNQLQSSDGCSSTSINEYSLDHGVNVYPNPNNGNFTLSVELLDKQDLTVKVFDVLGKTYYFKKHNQVLSVLDNVQLNNLPAGVYFIEVANTNDKSVKKLTIK